MSLSQPRPRAQAAVRMHGRRPSQFPLPPPPVAPPFCRDQARSARSGPRRSSNPLLAPICADEYRAGRGAFVRCCCLGGLLPRGGRFSPSAKGSCGGYSKLASACVSSRVPPWLASLPGKPQTSPRQRGAGGAAAPPPQLLPALQAGSWRQARRGRAGQTVLLLLLFRGGRVGAPRPA